MCPIPSFHDSKYCGLGYLEFIRQLLRSYDSENVSRTNCLNFFLCKFVHFVAFSSWSGCAFSYRATSAFFRAIAHIVSMCSKEKMGWIATWRVIAFVKALPIFKFTTVGNKPRDTMACDDNFPNMEIAISEIPLSTLPLPAFIWDSNFNVTPKSGLVFFGKIRDFSKSFHASLFRVKVSAHQVLNTLFGRDHFDLVVLIGQFQISPV